MKSILQDEKVCLVCGNPYCFPHHIYFGSANRKVSERHGFKVWLCVEHHTEGKSAPHKNRMTDIAYRVMCQIKYEETHSRESFMHLIGRNYL